MKRLIFLLSLVITAFSSFAQLPAAKRGKANVVAEDYNVRVLNVFELPHDTISDARIGSLAAFGDTVYIKGNPYWNRFALASELTLVISEPEAGAYEHIVKQYSSTPPGSPSVGDSVLVNEPATAATAFEGHDNEIAGWNGTTWGFTTANPGDYAYINSTYKSYQLRSGEWVLLSSGVVLKDKGNNTSGQPLIAGTNNNAALDLETNNIVRVRIGTDGTITTDNNIIVNDGGAGQIVLLKNVAGEGQIDVNSGALFASTYVKPGIVELFYDSAYLKYRTNGLYSTNLKFTYPTQNNNLYLPDKSGILATLDDITGLQTWDDVMTSSADLNNSYTSNFHGNYWQWDSAGVNIFTPNNRNYLVIDDTKMGNVSADGSYTSILSNDVANSYPGFAVLTQTGVTTNNFLYLNPIDGQATLSTTNKLKLESTNRDYDMPLGGPPADEFTGVMVQNFNNVYKASFGALADSLSPYITGGGNFGNTDLTFTGDRNHNASGHSFNIDSLLSTQNLYRDTYAGVDYIGMLEADPYQFDYVNIEDGYPVAGIYVNKNGLEVFSALGESNLKLDSALTLSANFLPRVNDSFNIGAPDSTFRHAYIDTLHANYIDAPGIGGGSYTSEEAQDAVGGIVANSSKISLTYNDATPSIVADIISGSIVNADINASAAIDASKIGGGSVSTTEYNYLSNVSADIQTQFNKIYVWTIAGQSNAQGQGDSTTSPDPIPGTVYQYYNGVLSQAQDPIGNASTGSAWPAFGIKWNSLTGQKVCFVPAAVPSSTQIAASDGGAGNWSATGTLLDTAVARTNAALSALTTAGFTPVYMGVLWSLGEADGGAITAATITKAQFKTGLINTIANFRTALGARMPFNIFRTGGSVTTGSTAVKEAQYEVDTSDRYTQIVYYNTADFTSRGLQNGAHYYQYGYDEMGTVGAVNIYKGTIEQDPITVSSNKVGIGTRIPAYNLDVNGTANITGATTLASTLNVTGSATFSNGIGTDATTLTKDIGASASVWRVLYSGTINSGTGNPLVIRTANPNQYIAFQNGTAEAMRVSLTNGNLLIGTTTDAAAADKIQAAGNVNLITAGNKIKIATGSNASVGTGTLSGGTATISTTAVTASSLIFIQYTGTLSNSGQLTISSKTAATSFTVTSTNASDANTFNWWIIN